MNETANIHWGELQDWAEVLFRLQEWLLHVSDDTIADYHEFTNGRQRFDDIVAQIGKVGHGSAGSPIRPNRDRRRR